MVLPCIIFNFQHILLLILGAEVSLSGTCMAIPHSKKVNLVVFHAFIIQEIHSAIYYTNVKILSKYSL
jgi:hypothetical protein